MNISTNYSNQSRMIASASHRQNVRNNNSQPCSNPTSNDINFTGLNLRSIYMPIKESIFGMSKEQKNRFNDLVDFIAPVLSKDNKEIKEMLQGQPAIRIDFLGRLSNRLNTTNFYKKAEEKESPELVIDLFNKIKKPTVRHLNFIDNVDMDMKNIKTCIEKYEVDDKKLEPTYVLRIGYPGRSYGLEVAKRYHLDNRVIEKAKKYLQKSSTGGVNDVLDELNRLFR